MSVLRKGSLKLKERGKVKDSWRKYYFVLTDTPSLVYYKSEAEFISGTSAPVGSIAISEAVQVSSFAKASQHGVRIERANGVDDVRCSTESGAKEWVLSLLDILTNVEKSGHCAAMEERTEEMDFNQLYVMRSTTFEADMSRNVLVDHVGACVLEVTGDDLVVWKKEGKELVCLVKWDLTTLRRYYYNETTFKVETGRRSATGEGVVTFFTKHGVTISKRIKLAAHYKKSQTLALQRPLHVQKHETDQSPLRKDHTGNDTVDDKVMDVSKAPHRHAVPIATMTRQDNQQLRRSRSLDDIWIGPFLSAKCRSPGAAVQSNSKFAPYHALHHVPAEDRPKQLDSYHHLEVNLQPGTAERYNNTNVKSNTILPYHHLVIDGTKQQQYNRSSIKRKESENVGGDGHAVYENLQFISVGDHSASTVDKNESRDADTYANMSSASATSSATTRNSDIYEVCCDVTESIQPNGGVAHKCSGSENDEISPHYENIGFGRQDTDNMSNIVSQSDGYVLTVSENETSEPDLVAVYDVADAASHSIYANLPTTGLNDRVQLTSDTKSGTERWTEKRMLYSTERETNSGEYSYPTVRSIRTYLRKLGDSQQVDDDDGECHYYGTVLHDDDDNDECQYYGTVLHSDDEAFPENIAAPKVTTSWHQNSPSVIKNTVPRTSSPFAPFLSLSASASPNTSRPASPYEVPYESDNELLQPGRLPPLQPGRLSPVSKQTLSGSLKGDESQDYGRPRAYQMDRERKPGRSLTVPNK